jgi:hypothetical protein
MGLHGAPSPTEDTPAFAHWLDGLMRKANVTNKVIADACNNLRILRPKDIPTHGERYKPLADKVTTPNKEIGQARRGRKDGKPPGPIPAYRIGRAIETTSNIGSGLDALVVAGHWHDAIACLGELMRFTMEELPDAWDPIFANVFNQTLQGPLPEESDIYPHLDLAWVRWITEPDPTRLPPTFFAAYLLAKSKSTYKRLAATSLLNAWQPLERVDVLSNDDYEAWKNRPDGKPPGGWLYPSEKKAKTDDD